MPEALSTGVPRLDALGAGWPIGSVSELCGDAGSGKSSLARHTVGALLLEGGNAVWVDADCTLRACARLWVIPSGPLHQVLGSLRLLLATRQFALVVVDPLPALCDAGNTGETRQVSSALRVLHRLARQYRVAVVAVNHPIAGDRSSPMPRSARPWGLRCRHRVALEPQRGSQPHSPVRTVWIRHQRTTRSCHLDLTELSADRIGSAPTRSLDPRVFATQATHRHSPDPRPSTLEAL